jgi:hypothetical protein
MILRVFVALLGAIVVTGSLLLGMDALTSMFRERDGQRYFRITDILPRPEPGRPERPAPAARQPSAPETETVLPQNPLTIDLPTDFDPARGPEPDITAPALAPRDDSTEND